MKYNDGSCIIKNAEDNEFQALRGKCELAIKELERRKAIREAEDAQYEQMQKEHKAKSIFSFLKPLSDFSYTHFETPPSYNGDWQIGRAIKNVLLAVESQPNEIHLPCELMADIMFLSTRQGSK